MEMPTGTIKKLVSDRGFGFIKAEDGQEYFFHRSGTEGDFDGLQGGEKVSFEIESSPNGPRAKSVRIAQLVNQKRPEPRLGAFLFEMGRGNAPSPLRREARGQVQPPN